MFFIFMNYIFCFLIWYRCYSKFIWFFEILGNMIYLVRV